MDDNNQESKNWRTWWKSFLIQGWKEKLKSFNKLEKILMNYNFNKQYNFTEVFENYEEPKEKKFAETLGRILEEE